jgi:altronate hydrolase
MKQQKDPAIIISTQDNVAVAKRDIELGIFFNGIKTRDFIPAGHRFALEDIPKNDEVRQYSYPFCISKGIKAGEKVSTINTKELSVDYGKLLKNFRSFHNTPQHERRKNYRNAFFYGYKRKDGSVGTRN